MEVHRQRRALLVGILIAGLLCASCATPPQDPLGRGAHARAAVPYAFAPASMRIHPISHLDRGESGRAIIVCHVELRDAWGDTCKGAGALQVQLYRALEGPDAGLERQELRWDVDLSDLAMNARLYDSATRTYRLPLKDLPGWVAMTEAGRPAARIKLKASLRTTGVDGKELFLQSEYVIE